MFNIVDGAHTSQIPERLDKSGIKRRNTIGCLDRYVSIETVKQSGLWSSLGRSVSAKDGDCEPVGTMKQSRKLFSFSLVDKLDIKLFPQDYNVFSLVDKPGIHEIRTFKLNLTTKIVNPPNQSPKSNFMVLVSIGDLLHGITENGVNFNFELFDHEGQGQLSPQNNWDLNQVVLHIWSKFGDPSLTHLPLDKMAAISQTTFWNAFLWMKSFVFWFEFHWNLFLRVL